MFPWPPTGKFLIILKFRMVFITLNSHDLSFSTDDAFKTQVTDLKAFQKKAEEIFTIFLKFYVLILPTVPTIFLFLLLTPGRYKLKIRTFSEILVI